VVVDKRGRQGRCSWEASLKEGSSLAPELEQPGRSLLLISDSNQPSPGRLTQVRATAAAEEGRKLLERMCRRMLISALHRRIESLRC